jgi:hypothetical protein
MTTALEGNEGSASRCGCSLPRERPGTHCTGGWVGQGWSGQVWKISPTLRFNPRIVRPVASRYTDYATQPTFLSLSEANVLLLWFLWLFLTGCSTVIYCDYLLCMIQTGGKNVYILPAVFLGNRSKTMPQLVITWFWKFSGVCSSCNRMIDIWVNIIYFQPWSNYVMWGTSWRIPWDLRQ